MRRLLLLCALASVARAEEPRKVSLRGEIVDADLGLPVAARVYIQGTDGIWYFARTANPAGSAVKYDKRRPIVRGQGGRLAALR